MNMGLLNIRVWGLAILCILSSCRQDTSYTEKNAVGLDSTRSKASLDSLSADTLDIKKADSMYTADCDFWIEQILALAEEDRKSVV